MPLHILLADDSVPAQNMGKKILTDAGFEVTTASNGLEAIRKIAEAVPDVAILDIFMPGYSGLEVCQKLRASAATASLPVILTVGKLEPYRPEDGASVHSNGVLVKPFIAAELVKTIMETAGQAATPTAAAETTPEPAAATDESDEPMFSYVPSISARDMLMTDESAPQAAPEAVLSLHDSPDSLQFNPDAKHIPFVASAIDGLIPNVSMGETRGAPVESVLQDANLELEETASTPNHGIAPLAPQGLLPEITPPPLDIPSLDPLLENGTAEARENIVAASHVEIEMPLERFSPLPETEAEVLTDEEAARRKAFEDLFNSDELPPLEEPAGLAGMPPSAGASVAEQFEAAGSAEAPSPSTPEGEAEAHGGPGNDFEAAFNGLASSEPATEFRPEPLLAEEEMRAWEITPAAAPESFTAEPEPGVEEAVEAETRAVELPETHVEPAASAEAAAFEIAPQAETAKPEIETEIADALALLMPETTGEPEPVLAPEPAPMTFAAAEPEPEVIVVPDAVTAAPVPEVAIEKEAETHTAIAPVEESKESLPVKPLETAVEALPMAHLPEIPAAAAIAAKVAEAAAPVAAAAAFLAPAVIPAHPEAPVEEPAHATPVVTAPPTPREPAIEAQASVAPAAAPVAAPEPPEAAAVVAQKPKASAAGSEEVRSDEAQRMHQAVERVIERFKPLLVAAIVRELARMDPE
ncbi:MAG: response regulator [Acidobacteriota bacterium]|nr:response regulator [Acidobacteriota bacterium]